MRIGVVSAKAGVSVRPFVEKGRKLGIGVVGLALERMRLEADREGSRLFLENHSVAFFDILLIRWIGDHLQELEVLLEFAKAEKIPIVDKGLYQVKVGSGSKSLTLLRLKGAGIPYIPSICFTRDFNIKRDILGSPPWILKYSMGKQGKDIFLVDNKEEIRKLVSVRNGLWMLQPFLQADGDYRVLVLGGKVLGAMHRRPTGKEEFRSNIATGGTATKVGLEKNVLSLAVRSAEACGWEFAGVDLIKDKRSEKWFVMEVNRAPQFAAFEKVTGIDVARLVLEYLEKKVGNERSRN